MDETLIQLSDYQDQMQLKSIKVMYTREQVHYKEENIMEFVLVT
jgi:hypothetical protein